MRQTKYPECEKWSKVHLDAASILQFLDWRDYHLTETVGLNYQSQVELYFGIDPNKLENERQAMLAEIQDADT